MVVTVGWLAGARERRRTADLRLVDAVKAGNRAARAELIAQHADVNAAEPDGMTALHWAVRADDAGHGAAAARGGRQRQGGEPLRRDAAALAATNGNAAVIELLLKAGADPNSAMAEGETVLMTAARTGKPDAVKALLVHGADVNARESFAGRDGADVGGGREPRRRDQGCCSNSAPTSMRGRRCWTRPS